MVNIIYVTQNYLVKTVELGAGEVSLVRGLLQMLVFSLIMLFTKKQDARIENDKNVESGEMLLRDAVKKKIAYVQTMSQLDLPPLPSPLIETICNWDIFLKFYRSLPLL